MAEAKITIQAVDEASDKLQNIYQATQRLEQAQMASTEQAGKFGGSLNDLSKSLTGMDLSTLAAAAAFEEFARRSVLAADDLNAVHNRAEALFGTDYPKMIEQTNALAEAYGRNSGEILNFETKLSTVLESIGIGTTKSEQMSDSLTRLAEDMSKAFHTDAADALRAIEMGLEGNVRGLRQYDIAISQKTLDDYAEAQGIHLKVSEMDAEQKAILTYHYLMDKTHAIQEAAAMDTGDLNDQIQRLEAAWTSLEQNLGQSFLPLAELVAQALLKITSLIPNLVQGLATGMQDMQQFLYGAGAKPLDQAGLDLANQNAALQQAHGVGMGKLSDTYPGNKKGAGAAAPAPWVGSEDWANHTKSNSDKVAKAHDEVMNSLDSLQQKYRDAASTISEKMTMLEDSHKSKVASIQSSIDDLTGSIKDMRNSYVQAIDDINGKKLDAIGNEFQKIAALDEKVKEAASSIKGLNMDQITTVIQNLSPEAKTLGALTQTEISGFNLDSNAVKQINDVMELNKRETDLKQSLISNHKLGQDQIDSLNVGSTDFVKNLQSTLSGSKDLQGFLTGGGKSDFVKTMEGLDKQQADKTKTYTDQVADATDKIKKKNVEMTEENVQYERQQKLLKNGESSLVSWQNTLVSVMQNSEKATKDSVKGMNEQITTFIQNLERMQAVLAKSVATASANDMARRVQLQAQGSTR